MLRTIVPSVALSILFPLFMLESRAHDPVDRPAPKDDRPLVQIALLLDTSNSMDGLINQARTQLWAIVNELSHCRRGGRIPRLQVALYEYGNNRLSPQDGWIRLVLPFTDDLDRVSEKLWSLRTCGGDEYCAQVIGRAVADLDWDTRPAVFRAIFIAGNEPFTQGPVDYHRTCKRAIDRGIVVNTIHCGGRADGICGSWEDGARIAEGKFFNIDQDRAHCAIAAPQDDELRRLSSTLNETYVPFGADGPGGGKRQREQDTVAATEPEVGADVQRAVAKASSNYQNAGWDLVDAVANGTVDLEKLTDKDLPAIMRDMSGEGRRAYVAKQSAERGEIQKKINDLNAQREKFVAAKQREQNPAAADTLDTAVIQAIRDEAKAAGFDVTEGK
ncbi:MAG: vWA domain-containing protein [Tepidisphaeraceae bacterium]